MQHRNQIRIPACVLLLPLLVALQAHAAAETTDARTRAVLDSLCVPEGFSVSVAAGPELSAYPMYLAFDPWGNLYVAESSGKNVKGKDMPAAPECSILRLQDVDGDGTYDTRTVFADRLSLPMGVLWYRGSVYTASPPDFLRLEDTNGDGVADMREVLLSGWNILNTASLHGPFLGPDGLMYLTHGRHGYRIKTKEGDILEGLAARIWRCRPDGTGLERICGGGFDNPVELIFTGAGETIATMTYITDPRQGKRDALIHFVEGGVYPKPHECISEFTRSGDLLPPISIFARVAPSGLEKYRSGLFGEDYKDNLFSAQFNPHRVQRHVLTRKGASFSSADSDFLTSSDPDFHPTDVLEDADGSLLVCDTGAWYVDACPLSRVAKPELRGAIYRIRRNGAPPMEDAWGLSLPWEKASTGTLIARLSDARPRVRDRAFDTLARQGASVLKPLIRHLGTDATEESRRSALWIVGQSDTEATRRALRAALRDSSPEIQIAAARMLGLRKDEAAVPALSELVLHGTSPVRRQAATALGQIAAPEAVDALRSAAALENDIFLDHAIIHALIQINADEKLLEALDDPHPAVRRASMIALDQRKTLTESQLTMGLADEAPRVRQAALWIAARHPEWADSLVAFLAGSLQAWERERADALLDLLNAFASNVQTQDLVAHVLADTQDPQLRVFLLRFMEQSAVNPFPENWGTVLARLLATEQTDVLPAVLNLVRVRALANLDTELRRIAEDTSRDDALRLSALDALLAQKTACPTHLFQFLCACLDADKPATTRQSAARILARAELSRAAAHVLAKSYLPTADALVFPSLLAAIGRHQDVETGRLLLAAVANALFDINRLPAREVDELLSRYPSEIQVAAAPLRARAAAEEAARLEKLSAILPHLDSGDVGRGRAVFFSEKAACSTCHAVGDEGGNLGPDLTTIGLVRSPHDLLEAVLFPNASLVQDYHTFQVETADQQYQGIIARDAADGITLRVAAGEDVYIPRGAILSMNEYPLSKMPEGLDAALSNDELIDLLAFLRSLNNEQWLLPERREIARH
jgi:putative membrane-bound dehydrogenase-like protein